MAVSSRGEESLIHLTVVGDITTMFIPVGIPLRFVLWRICMYPFHETAQLCLDYIDSVVNPTGSFTAGTDAVIPDMRTDVSPIAYCHTPLLASPEVRQYFNLAAIPPGGDVFLIYVHLLAVQFRDEMKDNPTLSCELLWKPAVQAVWGKLHVRQEQQLELGSGDPRILHLTAYEIREATGKPLEYPVSDIQGLFDQFDAKWPDVRDYYRGRMQESDPRFDPATEEQSYWRFRRFAEGQVLGSVSLHIAASGTVHAFDFLKQCASLAMAKVA